MSGLPPGDYRLAPVLDPDTGSWFDGSFLQQLDGASERFTLTDGEKKSPERGVGAELSSRARGSRIESAGRS